MLSLWLQKSKKPPATRSQHPIKRPSVLTPVWEKIVYISGVLLTQQSLAWKFRLHQWALTSKERDPEEGLLMAKKVTRPQGVSMGEQPSLCRRSWETQFSSWWQMLSRAFFF